MVYDFDNNNNELEIPHSPVVELRDYFAEKAMQGIIQEYSESHFASCAKISYAMADAMLEARK